MLGSLEMFSCDTATYEATLASSSSRVLSLAHYSSCSCHIPNTMHKLMPTGYVAPLNLVHFSSHMQSVNWMTRHSKLLEWRHINV